MSEEASTSASAHEQQDAPSPSASTSTSVPKGQSDWRAVLEKIDWKEIFGEQLAADETMAKRPKIQEGFADRQVVIVCRSNVDDKEIFRATAPYTQVAWSKMINNMFSVLPQLHEKTKQDSPIEIPLIYDPATCEWTPGGIIIALKYCEVREQHADEPIRKYADHTFREIRPNYEGWEHRFMVDMKMTNLRTIKPLYELFMSAQYLNIRDLIQLAANTLAFDYLITRNTEQLRELFGVTNDMTPEEHMKIDEEFSYIDL